MLNFLCKKLIISATIFTFILSSAFQLSAKTIEIANAFYYYADNHQYTSIHRLKKQYDINIKNDDGYTAYCLAKKDDNKDAMDVLKHAGADTEIDCGKSAIVPVVLGTAAVGGAVALALSLDNGGGGKKKKIPVMA